ncbi:MAG: DUF433 domain-containing protein [Candidatus Anammoxibacter sp.]
MVTKTVNEHIEITKGVSGGKPRISEHRITVQNIVIWHERMGMDADEIATEYGLTLSDVFAALAYYYDNMSNIDDAIRSDDAFIAELKNKNSSILTKKAKGCMV